MGITVNGAWLFEQTLNPVSTIGSTWNLLETGQVVSEEKLFNNIILYISTAEAGEGNPRSIKVWWETLVDREFGKAILQ